MRIQVKVHIARGRIGPDDQGRIQAILTFSNSLIIAWFFITAVFDAGETDPKRAARLRLSFRESAAMISTAVYMLTGLAGYILAGQGHTDKSAAMLVAMIMLVFVMIAAVLVGHLVKAAKTANTSANDECELSSA